MHVLFSVKWLFIGNDCYNIEFKPEWDCSGGEKDSFICKSYLEVKTCSAPASARVL